MYIIVGKAASGKDYLVNQLTQIGNWTYGISCTTRPKRPHEVEGVDYYFLNPLTFKQAIESGQFVEHQVFNNWYYGTTRREFEKADLFILNVNGLSQLNPADRAKATVIYLDTPAEIRRQRLAKRTDADDIERRMQSDEEQFADFTDYDILIKDANSLINLLTNPNLK